MKLGRMALGRGHGVAVLEARRDDVAPPRARIRTGEGMLPSVARRAFRPSAARSNETICGSLRNLRPTQMAPDPGRTRRLQPQPGRWYDLATTHVQRSHHR